MKITTVGMDLAKNVIVVHGVDDRGKVALKKALKRDQVLPFFTHLGPCVIGLEACGSSHHWARKLQALGHTVKLMAPQFVKPYVKTNKNDARDAEAICEAVARPHMRFVPVKTTEQQGMLALHRARQGFVGAYCPNIESSKFTPRRNGKNLAFRQGVDAVSQHCGTRGPRGPRIRVSINGFRPLDGFVQYGNGSCIP